MMRIAVIVIGSNSTRMVAVECGDKLSNISRRRVETRLFLRMENGAFSQEAILHLLAGLKQLEAAALQEHARLIGIFATSAVRDAANSAALAEAIDGDFSLPLTILSGDEEALYSFYGAAGDRSCGMIDIGGGSTEIAIGTGQTIDCALSLQLGASRLFGLQAINACSDVPLALRAAGEITAKIPADLLKSAKSKPFCLVGGTGTAAARMLECGAQEDGYILTRANADKLLRLLAATPREKRCDLPGFPASRIDIFPTGLAVLLAVMDALSLAQVEVTTRVNADGLLRAFVHKKFA